MGHLQTVETEFRKLLDEGDEEKIVRFVKEQVLASYRNGQTAQRPKGAGGETPPAATEPASPRRTWKKRA